MNLKTEIKDIIQRLHKIDLTLDQMALNQNRLVSVKEAALMLDLTEAGVRKRIRENKIPAKKICGKYRIKISELYE